MMNDQDRDTPPPSTPDLRVTQPIPPPTAEDVLTVFGHFREDLLKQIDTRDERILMAIQDVGSQILDFYERETKRGDEQDRWIRELRQRTHRLSGGQQTIELRLDEIERRLGIEPPKTDPPEEAEPA